MEKNDGQGVAAGQEVPRRVWCGRVRLTDYGVLQSRGCWVRHAPTYMFITWVLPLTYHVLQ